jgi:hypothetical protein
MNVQNVPIWTGRASTFNYTRLTHNGGSARCYQAIFVASATLGNPGFDGQPAVYLYIAALEVNVLNCRRQGLPDCHSADTPSIVHAPWVVTLR